MSSKGDLRITVAVGLLVFGLIVVVPTAILMFQASGDEFDITVWIFLFGVGALVVGSMSLTSGLLARKPPQ